MKYPYSVYQVRVEEHVFWVAKSASLNGCVGQGDELQEAVAELEENEKAWLETAAEFGIQIPPVPIEQESAYSGKFTVSVSPAVHQEAVSAARAQGISLNQYVNDAIVAQNERDSFIRLFQQRLSNMVQDAIYSGLHSVSNGKQTQTFRVSKAIVPQLVLATN